MSFKIGTLFSSESRLRYSCAMQNFFAKTIKNVSLVNCVLCVPLNVFTHRTFVSMLPQKKINIFLDSY